MKNSLKQMLRTPVRTILFLILLVLAAFLTAFGANLWLVNKKSMASYENKFMTIATVKQKASSISRNLVWDAERKEYVIWNRSEYDRYIPVSELLFEGADYLSGPEKRSYYGSYTPEYVHPSESAAGTNPGSTGVIEFSPLEDCVPEEAVQIEVRKVLGEGVSFFHEGQKLWFCDHENPDPEKMYKDKTYVAYIGPAGMSTARPHGAVVESKSDTGESPYEYSGNDISLTLYQQDGTAVPDPLQVEKTYFEVSEDFYETEIGKRMLSVADKPGYMRNSQPVTGTKKTKLILPFYDGTARICQGRDISEEEYQAGEKVCLAPLDFMQDNQLGLGDAITVRLYYTNADRAGYVNFNRYGGGGNFSLTGTDNRTLEPFEASEYTVVGIYDVVDTPSLANQTMGQGELVVPVNSIEHRDECNIVAFGAMRDMNTSFEIPNGTIDTFLTRWNQQGISELEFTFYDMGYTELQAGLRNMRNLSLMVLSVGVIVTAILILFFTNLFITKQKERTAIERSLGMTKKQCRRSLLSGLMILIILGSIAGSISGSFLSRNISAKSLDRNYYDRSYSVMQDVTLENEVTESYPVSVSVLTGVCCAALAILFGYWISSRKMNRSLQYEPMKLFSERKEG
ncbi:MAG: ABC transporter permease [Eubacteriales bacterium]|nr:ABC transporter permease [Eubacteriales bacterium]